MSRRRCDELSMEPILATMPHGRLSLTPFGVYFHLTRLLQRRLIVVLC
jgi:hypothetical protein